MGGMIISARNAMREEYNFRKKIKDYCKNSDHRYITIMSDNTNNLRKKLRTNLVKYKSNNR